MADPNRDEDMLIVRTREAHEAIKDLRAATRELRETIGEAREMRQHIIQLFALGADEMVQARIDRSISEGLENYVVSIKEAINTAEDAVFQRFEELKDWLMEGDTLEEADRRRQMEEMQETLDKRFGEVFSSTEKKEQP